MRSHIRKLSFFLPAICLAVGPRIAFADVTVVSIQTTTLFSPNKAPKVIDVRKSILYMKYGRQRTDSYRRGDVTPHTSGIWDAVLGRLVVIRWLVKEYYTDKEKLRPAFDPKKQINIQRSVSQNLGIGIYRLTATGQEKRIFGHTTELYRMSMSTKKERVTGEIWAAPDLPDDIQNISSGAPGYKGPYTRGTTLEQTIRTSSPRQDVVIKAVSISHRPIPDSMFDIPKGFKRVPHLEDLPS